MKKMKLTITFMAAIMGLLGVVFTSLNTTTAAEKKVHYVAIHVDQKDPRVMNLALNNVVNVNKYYASKGEKVVIEVVAYGPGLHMFRADTSPVKARIEKMSLQFDNLKFSACGNTRRKMSAKAGKKIAILPEAKMVPSGVIQLITLQEKGYAYLRP